MIQRSISFKILYLAIFVFGNLQCQPQQKEIILNNNSKNHIINWISEEMVNSYIFPEKAQKMSEYIRGQFKDGKYNEITDVKELIKEITNDLQYISNDEHVKLKYNENPPDSNLEIPEAIKGYASENYAFKELKHLSGNVGYLRFDLFNDPVRAGTTAESALNFVSNCDALIIDMRYNSGGFDEMTQLVLGYFFNDPLNYMNTYNRKEDTTRQYWTKKKVNGKKMLETELYILTSSDITFSQAEIFAFALQNQGRATIVGETTSGGSHGIEFYYLNEYNIELWVPVSRIYEPKTKETFEGVGVVPDIKISSEQSFDYAYMLALKNLAEKAKGEKSDKLKWLWEYQSARVKPLEIEDELLNKYAGSYGSAIFKIENGSLYFLEPGEDEYRKCFALSNEVFVVDGNEDVRGEFVLDKEGHVIGVDAIHISQGKRRLNKNGSNEGNNKNERQKIDKSKFSSENADWEYLKNIGLKFIEIDGGSFDMGDVFKEGGKAELPVHPVIVDGFYISEKEITFKQFDLFCEATNRIKPDDEGWGRGKMPVINISWNDMQDFCEWLTDKCNVYVRLPYEAEWEYAAREKGKEVRFGNGKNLADPSQINFKADKEDKKEYSITAKSIDRTAETGMYLPNTLGLFDMSGNVSEMCFDWYNKDFYKNSPEKNPTGPETGQYKVIRGGAWSLGPQYSRCTSRLLYTPDEGGNFFGFRVVLEK